MRAFKVYKHEEKNSSAGNLCCAETGGRRVRVHEKNGKREMEAKNRDTGGPPSLPSVLPSYQASTRLLKYALADSVH